MKQQIKDKLLRIAYSTSYPSDTAIICIRIASYIYAQVADAKEQSEDIFDDEIEYAIYLEELRMLFLGYSLCTTEKQKKDFSREFVSRLPWENFMDDDGSYYTLGSMYYNKLSWILENSTVQQFKDVANLLIKDIKPILDEIEEEGNLNKNS